MRTAAGVSVVVSCIPYEFDGFIPAEKFPHEQSCDHGNGVPQAYTQQDNAPVKGIGQGR